MTLDTRCDRVFDKGLSETIGMAEEKSMSDECEVGQFSICSVHPL